MTSTKLRARPDIDYAQLIKEIGKLALAERLLINRRGDFP